MWYRVSCKPEVAIQGIEPDCDDHTMADYDTNTDDYLRWSAGDSDYWLLEQTRYFEVLGSVRNLNILELACGAGRISRMLMGRGAQSVVGTDISKEMIKQAVAQNQDYQGSPVYSNLIYKVVDACDETFTLGHPVDLVTAMYLFHYAPSQTALEQMCRHINRNLKPGGRFVATTLNPGCDFNALYSDRLKKYFGFSIRTVEPPHYHLMFDKLTVNMWQWSREAHEGSLNRAGMTHISWHPLQLPSDRQDLTDSLQWYLDNPSCIVLSAEKPSHISI